MPGLTEIENPIRMLAITSEVLSDFMAFRIDATSKFRIMNLQYQKQEFDRCISCWLYEMYKGHEEHSIDRKYLAMYLNFVDAHQVMYKGEYYGVHLCVNCKGRMPLGLLPNQDQIVAFSKL